MRIFNNLKSILLLCVVFSYSFVDLYSIEEYKKLAFKSKIENIGYQPTHIIKINEITYDVFCLGKDFDFNGTIDESAGEEFPSWWRVHADVTLSSGAILFTTERIMEFKDDFIQLSFKPQYDTTNNIIYLNCTNTVKMLNVNSKSIENPDVFGSRFLGSYHQVLLLWDGKLVTTKYENFQSDSIRIFEDYTLNKSIKSKSIKCGNNTISCKYISFGIFDMLAILDQGTFGNANSKIYTIFNPKNLENTEVESDSLGNGANSFLFENPFNGNISVGYLVMSGDNLVNVGVFDGDEYVFKLGDPGTFEGPREVFTMPEWNYFYVSTYGRKLFVFDKSFANSDKPNLNPIDVLDLSGKGEKMSFHPTANHLLVLTPSDSIYTPINSIDVFYDPTFTSVEEVSNNSNNLVSLYPNPIENNNIMQVSLENDFSTKSITKYEIYDISGNLVDEDLGSNTNNISVDLSTLNLVSGRYFIKLQFENGFLVKSFSVSK